jgi:intracellular sulfur oxidation DsrE/DsrF family protein
MKNTKTKLAVILTVLTMGVVGGYTMGNLQSVKAEKDNPVAVENRHYKYNVVMELNIPDDIPTQNRWQVAINNIKAAKNQLDDDIRIELVAYGDGLPILLKQPVTNASGKVTNPYPEYAAQLEELSKMGIDFVACENTMKKIGASKDDLLPFVRSVPAGAVEVIKKQQEGWQYIKAE